MEDNSLNSAWDTYREKRNWFHAQWNLGTNRRTIAVLLAIALPLSLAYVVLVQSPSTFPTDDIITVESDQSLAEIAASLEAQEVVRSAGALEIIVRVMGGARTVHAGDYQFHQPQSAFSIARAIIHGYYGLTPVRVRIPEGTTVTDMAAIYDRLLPRFDAERFIEIAKPNEGYYFPDTYFFLPNATEETVAQTMRENFDARIETLREKIDASGHTLDEILTMASIIELEAHIYHDRRMIAGLLWNRIAIDMPLQVDAAFLYFLGKSTFSLTLQDLQYDSPYNTYKYKGLPPGPITNPSLRAIEATVDPIENDYIFYLADHSGVTHFSRTYQEHLQKKRLYLGT